MSEALYDFMGQISVEKLLVIGTNVSQGMTGNTHFPDAVTLTTAVTNALDAYSTASARAKRGSESDKLIAAEAKATLQGTLRELCKHVNYKTSDRILLLTTGFNLKKESRANIVLGDITQFTAYAGREAETIVAGFKRPVGMQTATFSWKADGDTAWTTLTAVDLCKVTIKGVPPGVPVSVRVTVSGPRNQTMVSQTVIAYASFVASRKRA